MSSAIIYEVKVYPNGDKVWYLNGKLHREDGPAIEEASGHKEWFLNGKQHREDGAAVEYANGDKEWYLNGKCLTHSEWKQEVAKLNQPTCKGKVVEIEGKKYQLLEIK